MHRLPAKRRWVGEGLPGRYQEYNQTKVIEIGKSRMETRQEEKEEGNLKVENQHINTDRQAQAQPRASRRGVFLGNGTWRKIGWIGEGAETLPGR